MKVNCPGCSQTYKVDDHRIPPTGIKMKCPKCGKAFKVSMPGAAPAAAPAQPVAKPPMAKPMPPSIPTGPTTDSLPPVFSDMFGGERKPEPPPSAPAASDNLDDFGAVDLPGLSVDISESLPASPPVELGEEAGVDLPAPVMQPPAAPPGAVDLPAPVMQPPAATPGAVDLPAPAMQPPAAPPGAVDLPAPVMQPPAATPGGVDLPAPVMQPPAATPGGVDLPAPVMQPPTAPPGAVDLPAPVMQPPAATPGGVDLPAPVMQPPAATPGGVDLPAPVMQPPAATPGGVDLPAPVMQPPAATPGGVALPAPVMQPPAAPPGAVDLPAPVNVDDVFSLPPNDLVPMPTEPPLMEGAPVEVVPDAPTPSFIPSAPARLDDKTAGIDLPTPVQSSAGLPSPDAPSISDDTFGSLDLPSAGAPAEPPNGPQLSPPDLAPAIPASHSAEKGRDFEEFELPSPAAAVASGAPPSPTAGGQSGEDFGNIDFGAAPDLGATPDPSPPNDDEYGQFDLGSASPEPTRDSGEFDGFPIATESSPSMPAPPIAGAADFDTPMGSGLDLATDNLIEDTHGVGQMLDDLAPADDDGRKASSSFIGRRKLERETRRVRVIFLSFLAVLLVGGGALTFTSHGPFGAYALIKFLPRITAGKVVTATYERVEKRLAGDNIESLNVAIEDVNSKLQEYPDHEELRLIGVYLLNWKQYRFGDEKKSEKMANSLLGDININENDSVYASLVKATQALLSDKWKEAKAALSGETGKTNNALTLRAEASLKEAKYDEAIKIASVLEDKERSRRSKYLLARAYAGIPKKEPDALNKLKEMIDVKPIHPEGLMLYLRLSLIHNKDIDLEDATKRLEAILASAVKTDKQRGHAQALLGAVYLRRGMFSEAKNRLDEAEKLDSSDPVMLVGRGDMMIMASDASAASTYYTRAVSIEPNNLMASLGQVDCTYRLGSLGEAKTTVIELIKTFPENAQAHYLLGRIETALKNTVQGETELLKAIELDAAHMDAYVALSELYLQTNEEQKALDILAKAAEAIEESPIIHLTFADAYAARSEFATAIEELDKAIALDPVSSRAFFRKAQMFRKLRKLSEAQASLEKVEGIDANYPGLFLEQGRLMEFSGQLEDALHRYEKALADSPDNLDIKVRLGAAAHLLEQYERAEKLLLEVLDKEPKSAEANFFLGEAYRLTNRTAEAVLLLQTAQSIAGDQALYHLRYGAALLDLRRFEEAREALQKSAKIEADSPEFYTRLGTLELRMGAARSAINNFETAVKIQPDYAMAYLRMGEAYEQLSKARDAYDNYKLALKKIRDNPELHFRYGLATMRLKGQKDAVPRIKKGVDLAMKEPKKHPWLTEGLYRLGVAQASTGATSAAIETFKKYLEIAPEDDIDRSEVLAHLERLGAS